MRVKRRGGEPVEMTADQLRALGPLLSEYLIERTADWETPPVAYWAPATRLMPQTVALDEPAEAVVIRDQ